MRGKELSDYEAAKEATRMAHNRERMRCMVEEGQYAE